MAKMTVKDTIVRMVQEFPGPDGGTWKRLEIQWQDMKAGCGQYVMLGRQLHDVNWPKPMMIEKISETGFTVAVHPGNPLYEVKDGETVTAYGPSGTALEFQEGESFAALSNASGLLLSAPILNNNKERCQGLYLVGDGDLNAVKELVDERIPVTLIEKVADLADAEKLPAVDKFLLTLPLQQVGQWKKQISPETEQRSIVFVGAKIGCGMGACRGCYIHSPQMPQGLPVCQKGPFLPMDTVNYKQDQNFLIHFI